MKALVCLTLIFTLAISKPLNKEEGLRNIQSLELRDIDTSKATKNLQFGYKSLIKNPFKSKASTPSASGKDTSTPKDSKDSKPSKRLRPGKRRPPPKKTDEELLREMDINQQLDNCLEGIVNFSGALGYLVISLGTQFTRIFGILMNTYYIATSCTMLRYAKVPDVCKYEVKKLPSVIRKKLIDIKKYRKEPDFLQFLLEDLGEKFQNVKLLCHLENKHASDFTIESSSFQKIEKEVKATQDEVYGTDLLVIEKEIE